MDMKQRCKTGIHELDEELNGGFPVGSTVLFAGSSGVGKTTLSMQFLVNGVKMGERGVFFSSTENINMLKRFQNTYDFFDEKLVKSGQICLIDLWSISDRLGLNSESYSFDEANILFEVIRDIAKEMGAKRLVIDSITSLCFRLNNRAMIRDFIFKLGSSLTLLNCTTILTSEVPPLVYQFSQNEIEEFIADGIIFLGNLQRGVDLIRTLQVVKMRGISHSRTKFTIHLSAQNGVELTPILKASF
jgi:circadian clock protein KaiC